MTGDKRVYLVDGVRTPFLKAGNKPGPFSGGDLTVGCGDNVPARTVMRNCASGMQACCCVAMHRWRAGRRHAG